MKNRQYVRIPNAVSNPDREAMQDVLKKWETIIQILEDGNTPTNTRNSSCAFCVNYGKYFCRGCPIQKYTGEISCRHTPFTDFSQSENFGSHPMMLKHARRELEFLRKLAQQNNWLEPKTPFERLYQNAMNIFGVANVKAFHSPKEVHINFSTVWTGDMQRLYRLAEKYKSALFIRKDETMTAIFHGLGKGPFGLPTKQPEKFPFRLFGGPTVELSVSKDEDVNYDHDHLVVWRDGKIQGYCHLLSDGAHFFKHAPPELVDC